MPGVIVFGEGHDNALRMECTRTNACFSVLQLRQTGLTELDPRFVRLKNGHRLAVCWGSSYHTVTFAVTRCWFRLLESRPALV